MLGHPGAQVVIVILLIRQDHDETRKVVWCDVAEQELSATAWKCTKAGKMKMRHFSGTKFAVGLAWETQNPLP
jgi:hypothetical protein